VGLAEKEGVAVGPGRAEEVLVGEEADGAGDSCESDQVVDPGFSGAEEPFDQVEVEDADASPVEPSDDEDPDDDPVEPFHVWHVSFTSLFFD
jgi:hypothetical protein